MSKKLQVTSAPKSQLRSLYLRYLAHPFWLSKRKIIESKKKKNCQIITYQNGGGLHDENKNNLSRSFPKET